MGAQARHVDENIALLYDLRHRNRAFQALGSRQLHVLVRETPEVHHFCVIMNLWIGAKLAKMLSFSSPTTTRPAPARFAAFAASTKAGWVVFPDDASSRNELVGFDQDQVLV